MQLGSLSYKLGSACAAIAAKQRHVCLGPPPVETLEMRAAEAGERVGLACGKQGMGREA